MNELQIFNYEGAQVRTVQHGGEPWWVLKDVCDVLGIVNPSQTAQRLDDDERALFDIGRSSATGGGGETNIVSESGLYNVIIRSDKPEARKFKRWVTREVLPSIRKHGAYMTPDALEAAIGDPTFAIGLLTALKKEQDAKERLQIEADAMRPKALFADAVAASDSTILVGELAKILKGNGIDIGQNRLFQRLRDEGFLIRRKGMDFNMPSQRSMELGLFKIKENSIVHADGHVTVTKTPKVTAKGQQYFINNFLGKSAPAERAERGRPAADNSAGGRSYV
jgi:anti-repressor protein